MAESGRKHVSNTENLVNWYLENPDKEIHYTAEQEKKIFSKIKQIINNYLKNDFNEAQIELLTELIMTITIKKRPSKILEIIDAIADILPSEKNYIHLLQKTESLLEEIEVLISDTSFGKKDM